MLLLLWVLNLGIRDREYSQSDGDFGGTYCLYNCDFSGNCNVNSTANYKYSTQSWLLLLCFVGKCKKYIQCSRMFCLIFKKCLISQSLSLTFTVHVRAEAIRVRLIH